LIKTAWFRVKKTDFDENKAYFDQVLAKTGYFLHDRSADNLFCVFYQFSTKNLLF